MPVRKSTIEISWKNSKAGANSAITIPTVVATEMSAQRPRTTLMTSSPYRLRRARSRSSRPRSLRVPPTTLRGRLRDRCSPSSSCSSVSGTNCEASAISFSLLEHVADERLHLWPGERVLLHVDEKRAREWRIRPVLRRLDTRLHAAVAAVDVDSLQRVLVLLEVGEAEVAEAALLARNAGDDRVVVLAGSVVGTTRAFLAVDLVGEVVERARVGAGAEERELVVRERGSTWFQFSTLEPAPRSSSAGRWSGR